MIAALFLGRGPSLLVTLLGVLAFDFFLIPPYLTFAVSDTQYLVTFAVLFIVGLVVSTLAVRVRDQAEAAIQREAHTAALFSLGRELTSSIDLNQVADTVIAKIQQVFGGDAALYIPVDDRIQLFTASPGYQTNTNHSGVATLAFEHGKPAGLGTDTLPAVKVRCQPLKTARGMVGVMGIQPEQTGILSNPEQRQILDSFANQAALAIERTLLEEQARQAEILKVTEKLQSSLLNSISHDLRTPLVSITGALSSLRAKNLVLDQASRETLLDTAFEEAERLNRLVGNLLNMTRIEAGAIHLQKEPCDIQDALGAAIEQLGERLQMRELKIIIPPDLGLVMVDIPLFEQVLVNLLDNAVKYSTEDTAIEINVVQADSSVQIDICDRGIGIPEAALELIFDKFYRVQRPERVTGTGLGLAICRGIVEAHGGTIVALNRPGGGSVLRVILPKVTPS